MKSARGTLATVAIASILTIAGCSAAGANGRDQPTEAPAPEIEGGWVDTLDPAELPPMGAIGSFDAAQVTALRDYLAKWEAAAMGPAVRGAATAEEAGEVLRAEVGGPVVDGAVRSWTTELPGSIAFRFVPATTFTSPPELAWSFQFEETDLEGTPALSGVVSSRLRGATMFESETLDFALLRNLSVTAAEPTEVGSASPGEYSYNLRYYAAPGLSCPDGRLVAIDPFPAGTTQRLVRVIGSPGPSEFVDWEDVLAASSEEFEANENEWPTEDQLAQLVLEYC